MSYKVLFDGNGSGIIQVVGLGLFVPAEKHNEVMQKWEQAQAERDALAKEVDAANDRNAELIEERDALAARIQTAERVEKIFSEMPELKFDDCLKLFADEIRNVQAEAGRRGYLEAALNFDPDYDAWWSAEQYADTVRQGGE